MRLPNENPHEVPHGTDGTEQMRANLAGSCILTGTLVVASLTLGCIAVVVPVKPGATEIADSDNGLVFGRIHLIRNGKDQRAGLRFPSDVEWWIAEKKQERRFVVDDLPIDGPFVVKLPSGHYRLTVVSFDDVLGEWQASLPATFTVQSHECTYLGTWELQMQVGLFTGEIARQVLNQLELAQDDLRMIIGDVSCPITTAPLESLTEGSVRLTSPTPGTE